MVLCVICEQLPPAYEVVFRDEAPGTGPSGFCVRCVWLMASTDRGTYAIRQLTA